MATTKTKKTPGATAKKASTGKKVVKKSGIKEQIENLDKALETYEEKNAIDFVPDEVKADIVAENNDENPKETNPIDFDAEVKNIFENTEPSEELSEQISEFESGKEEFNKELEGNPEKAEEIVNKEIDRVEEIKKNLEAIRQNLEGKDSRVKNSDFTNLWNGMGFDLF